MAKEQSQPPEIDLDKTDRLPILEGVVFAHDVEDDAVPMDQTAVLTAPRPLAASGAQDFVRPRGVDLPSLAESVRSVEERIARQNAEYESLTRSYERLRDAEAAAASRADALAADLAAARTALESEQSRSREIDKALAERNSSVETARLRFEEALRDSERHQGESRTLRESLAARDTAMAQVQRSLGERDAQLVALQREHAKVVPALEARLKSAAQLEADLRATRDQASATALELKASQDSASGLGAKLKRAEFEAKSVRAELAVTAAQATSYFELLQTREWRGGFDQNLFRELDGQVGVAQAAQRALKAERDELLDQVTNLQLKLGAQDTAIDKLQSAIAAHTKTVNKQADDLKHAEQAGSGLSVQLAALETERARLSAELAARDVAAAEAQAAARTESESVGKSLAAAERRESELAAQIKQLQSEHAVKIVQMQSEQAAQIAEFESAAQAKDQEMNVLMAHLLESRRPLEPIQAEVKRLTEELAHKSAELAELAEEHRKTHATLERTRGALEEREFLIRRLERSESNNANVLGRIQTSIERLGSVPVGPGVGSAQGSAPAAEWTAELIRIDGERPVTHVLSRRTRIGRASGCELQFDVGSVSRHHALILVGPREAIIEDLNSTNGVLVNGRKVSRQPLSDGDAVTIGEIQFRFIARPLQGSPEQRPAEPAARE